MSRVLCFMISLSFDFMQSLLVHGNTDFVEELDIAENIW